MPTASLDDVQSIVTPPPSAPATGMASMDDIQAVRAGAAPQNTGRASLDDIVSVQPAPQSPTGNQPSAGTASLSDVVAVHGSPQAPGPAEPSVWEHIKNFFDKPLVGIEAMPQLAIPIIAGKAASQYFESHGHPTAAKVAKAYTGIEQGEAEMVSGMSSPKNLGIMAATGGLGAMEGVAGPVISRLVSAGFSAQSLYAAYKNIPEIRKALQSGDVQGAAKLLTQEAANIAIAGTAGAHAIKGRAVSGKATAETIPLSETKPIHPDSPLAQVVRDSNIPDVRLTDTAATKQHLESHDTVAEAKRGPQREPLVRFTDEKNLSADKPQGLYFTIGKESPHTDLPGTARMAELRGQNILDVNTQDEFYRQFRFRNAPITDVSTGIAALRQIVGDAEFTNLAKMDKAELVSKLNSEFPGPKYAPFDKYEALEQYAGQLARAKGYDALRSIDTKDTKWSEYVALNDDAFREIVPQKQTARVVSENHIPVVSKDEVLADTIQRMVNNSREIAKLGLDPSNIESRQDVTAMLDKAADHIQANLDPRATSTLTFEMQKQLASELGMTVEDLLSRKSGAAFSAEQAIASRALLHGSGTNVMNLARLAAMGDETYLDEFTKSLAQHQAILDSVKGITAEAGRALGSFNIKEGQLPQLRVAEILSKLPQESQLKAAKLLSKINPNDKAALNSFIEQITPASVPDKIFEYYRNALLSSPKTLIVKSASEATMMALEATKKLVAATISKGKSLVTGAPQERFASEAFWYAKGAAQALQHTKAVLIGEFNLEDAPGFERTGKQAIKGPIGSVVRLPGAVLSRLTNLMYTLNYFGELNAQAARQAITEGLSGEELHARQEYLAHNPTPEISEAANSLALKNTFQSELGKFGRIVQGAIKNDPTGLGKYLFPFFRTPINLVKATAEYSPYGLFKGLLKGDLDLQARGLVGSSLAAGIAHLALEGHITGGGPVDFRKKETLESTGWQPYSIKIGNKYYSYHRWEPLGLAMGLVADAIHGMKAGDSSEVTQSKADTAVSHIERNLADLPFLFQLSSIIDAVKDTSGKRINNFINRQVASFIPAIVANVAEGTDRTVRHPVGLTQTIQSRIPGQTEKVPPVLDIRGEPVQRPASQLGGANPFPVTTAKNDPVVSELARLGISTSQPPKSVTLRKKPSPLSDDEQQAILKQEDQLFIQNISRIMKSSGWQRRNDDQKREAVKKLRSEIARSRPARVVKLRGGRVTPTSAAILGSSNLATKGMNLDESLDAYDSAKPDEQEGMLSAIFPKIVDWRKLVRRGQVDEKEKSRMNARINDFNRQVRQNS